MSARASLLGALMTRPRTWRTRALPAGLEVPAGRTFFVKEVRALNETGADGKVVLVREWDGYFDDAARVEATLLGRRPLRVLDCPVAKDRLFAWHAADANDEIPCPEDSRLMLYGYVEGSARHDEDTNRSNWDVSITYTVRIHARRRTA